MSVASATVPIELRADRLAPVTDVDGTAQRSWSVLGEIGVWNVSQL